MNKPLTSKRKDETHDAWQRRVLKLLRAADATRESTRIAAGLKRLSQADQFLHDLQHMCTIRYEDDRWVLVGPSLKPGEPPWFRVSLNNHEGWRKAVIKRRPRRSWSPNWGKNQVMLDGKRVVAWFLLGEPQLYNLRAVHTGGTMEDPEFQWISRSQQARLNKLQSQEMVLEMREKGRTMSEIAKALHISRQAVYNALPRESRREHRYPVRFHKPKDRERVHEEKRALAEAKLIRRGEMDPPVNENSLISEFVPTTDKGHRKTFKDGKTLVSKSITTFPKDIQEDDYDAYLKKLEEEDRTTVTELVGDRLVTRPREPEDVVVEKVEEVEEVTEKVEKTEIWHQARTKSEKLGLGPVPLGLQESGLRGKVGEDEHQEPPHARDDQHDTQDDDKQHARADDVTGDTVDDGLSESHDDDLPTLDVET